MKTNLLLIVFGAFCIFAAAKFPNGGAGVSEAALCPMFAAAGIVVFAVADIVFGRRAARESAESAEQPAGWRMFAGLAAMLAAYAAVMPLVGFVASTAPFCAAVLLMLGYKNILRAFGFGCAFAVVLYIIFGGLMNVALPCGILN